MVRLAHASFWVAALAACGRLRFDPVGDGGFGDGGTGDAALASPAQQAYIKASNTANGAEFGSSLALSADGSTLAVGSYTESSNATGIDGNQNNALAPQAGAVYMFIRTGMTWSQQAYVKASNTRTQAFFGCAVALSADGNTLAVGSYQESSAATGIGGNQLDTSAADAGAVYVLVRVGAAWSQQAYIKASNTNANDNFGTTVALASDGNTLAVGARSEASAATGIDGNQLDNSAPSAGAVYVFARVGATWSQQAYVKASNTRTLTGFGGGLALSGDGNTLAVGSDGESSAATGIGGNQGDTSAQNAGAAYAFTRSGSTWTQQAYIKASNTRAQAAFGASAALSGDGNTLAVGSFGESSGASGIDGNQADTSKSGAGAVYVLLRSGGTWSQQAYVKASNPDPTDQLGTAVSLSGDGSTLAAAAIGEASAATGIDGDQTADTASFSGATYTFGRSGATWQQLAYVKASNTRGGANFGFALAVSADASTLAAGAVGDTSAATGIDGNQNDTSVNSAGAVYVFH
jgi:hypothetical protein